MNLGKPKTAYSLLELTLSMTLASVVLAIIVGLSFRIQQQQLTNERILLGTTKLVVLKNLFTSVARQARVVQITDTCAASTSSTAVVNSGNCLTAYMDEGIALQFEALPSSNELRFNHYTYTLNPTTQLPELTLSSKTSTPFLMNSDTTLPSAFVGAIAFTCNRDLNTATAAISPCFRRQGNQYNWVSPQVFFNYNASNMGKVERVFLNLSDTQNYWMPIGLGSFSVFRDDDVSIAF